MKRADIPGQEELKNVLTAMVDRDSLPHALLIHEQPGGTGLVAARFLTQYLLCENKQGGDTCGSCANCIKVQNNTHPDVHYIFPVNKTKGISKSEHFITDNVAEEVRAFLANQPYGDVRDWYTAINIEKNKGIISAAEGKEVAKKLMLRAYEGGYRIFIVWTAELMNDTFANKILKNLEEPSDKTIFLLVTSTPSQLLTTIVSRVQRFQEDPVSEDVLANFLVNRLGLNRPKALDLAFRAEGNVHEAMKEAEGIVDPWLEEFKKWMRMAYVRDIGGMHNWCDKMSKNTRDAQIMFATGALKVIDRCYRLGWMDINIPMEGEEAKFYKDFSPFINTANAEGFLDLIQEAAFHIERNVNPKIVWFDTSIKAIRLVHAGKKSRAQAQA